jgi:hypothetical protein
MITIDIIPGRDGQPPMIRASSTSGPAAQFVVDALNSNTDEAMVARTMLSSAAYLFAKGQPVEFGPEIPREVLR